jgi:hypothetical protein
MAEAAKWEYTLVDTLYKRGGLRKWLDEMDRLGREGWEAVGQVDMVQQGSMGAAVREQPTVLLKRRID